MELSWLSRVFLSALVSREDSLDAESFLRFFVSFSTVSSDRSMSSPSELRSVAPAAFHNHNHNHHSCWFIIIVINYYLLLALASPATGHWGTCPLDFQLYFFLVTSEPHKLWHWSICSCLPPPQKKYSGVGLQLFDGLLHRFRNIFVCQP